MSDFRTLAEIIKAAGTRPMMTLVKCGFVRFCIGVSIFAWTIDFKLPLIIQALR
jgi:hypothetical protein